MPICLGFAVLDGVDSPTVARHLAAAAEFLREPALDGLGSSMTADLAHRVHFNLVLMSSMDER
jgi:hypothetical protein